MNNTDLTGLGLLPEQMEEASRSGLYIARICAQYKNIYRMITEAGECRAVVSGNLLHSAEAVVFPAVGDWVLADRADDTAGEAQIRRVLPRKSCLMRIAAGTRPDAQVLAANIDTVFICMSLNQDFNLRRLERYLTLVWDSMATPVVVVTKSDLQADLGPKLLELEQVAAGVELVWANSVEQNGLDGLAKHLGTGRTVAFIGSSGVGKSTMINRLLGTERQATKEIRSEDGRGRHATTVRELFVLPDGGVVIDMPGMRELRLHHADVSKAFAYIEELAKGCRFRDCKHDKEPHCAVKQAVEDGLLPAERLENYKKLQKERLYEETKETAGAARAEKQKIIGMMGSLGASKRFSKQNPKNR